MFDYRLMRPPTAPLSTCAVRVPTVSCRTAAKEQQPSTATPSTAPIPPAAQPLQQQQQYQDLQQLTTNSAQAPPSRSSTTGGQAPQDSSSVNGSSSSSANGIKAPKAPKRWNAPTAAISVSGPYLTTSSIDGDSLVMSAEFLERELVGPYKFRKEQVGSRGLRMRYGWST